MKKTARVIVTKKCNRRCKGCCNDYIGMIDRVTFEDLFKYEEIVITGGEPLLMPDRVIEMIHRLKFHGFRGKIWMYTAHSRKLGKHWAVEMVIDEVDGITYTIHHGALDKLRADLADLRRLDKYLSERAGIRGEKSDRLFIDSRVYSQEYVDSLKHKWAVIKPLEWKEDGDCPVPENEELVFYDLEAEGAE